MISPFVGRNETHFKGYDFIFSMKRFWKGYSPVIRYNFDNGESYVVQRIKHKYSWYARQFCGDCIFTINIRANAYFGTLVFVGCLHHTQCVFSKGAQVLQWVMCFIYIINHTSVLCIIIRSLDVDMIMLTAWLHVHMYYFHGSNRWLASW